MNLFEFEKDFKKLDNRSIFANRICKLIYIKNDSNVNKSIKEAEPYFNDLYEHVRNIYELIENEIPLFAYYELAKHGADNYGFTEQEYEEAMMKIKIACNKYYNF